MKEDTLMRIPFGSLACVPKRKSGKANQAVTSSSDAEYWTDDNSEAGSNNDFLETAESTEDERIAIQFASKNDELLQALEEDSDSSDKASAWAWSKDARKSVLRAQCSAWLQWVYRQYDAYDLARRSADLLGLVRLPQYGSTSVQAYPTVLLHCQQIATSGLHQAGVTGNGGHCQ
ncbi:unnamed protein product [Sphagnum jensenii]|uniref:Uncharacterized protein n=1 Tax=Sphagnum jensenii TaxID=128206 RepID=A0ABP1AHJ6_9BRYO